MSALILALLFAAQTSRPSDYKSFQAAASVKEPDKKIEALEKFLKENPESNYASQARRELVTAAVELSPAKAPKRVEKLAKGLGPADSASLYRSLASQLLSKDKELNAAAKAASTGLKLFTFESFAAAERRDAERSKRKPPADDSLQRGFKIERARYVETLAQTLAKQGKTSKAQPLFEEVLRDNPASATSANALGEIYDKVGKSGEALGYYAQAMLVKATPESRKIFYEAWTKAKGSGNGAEEFLDQRYRGAFPAPLHPVRYEKTSGRSSRVALAEVYTGAGCPPCVAADLAFDAVLERYSRSDVAVVMYHQHIPRPDPMTNDDTKARWKWQEGRGVPTYGVDGKMIPLGGGTRENAGRVEEAVRAAVEKQLEATPRASLELTASHDGQAVRARGVVAGIKSDSSDLMLTLVLIEKEVSYSGENGIRFHPMVARSIVRLPIRGAASFAQTYEFPIEAVNTALKTHLDALEKHDERYNKEGNFRFMARPDTVNPAHLAVVAYVQDSRTREVLQAAYADAPAPALVTH